MLPFKPLKTMLSFNLKTLIVFEVFYRLFGVFLIYPLTRLLFFASIRVAGYQYITNQMILTYLRQPSTLVILLLLLVVFSFYVLIEMVFLSVIYDYSYHREKLDVLTLYSVGVKQSWRIIRRYKMFALLPALFMFFIFEAFHIVGFASTISIPRIIVEEIEGLMPLSFVFYGLIIGFMFLFVESMYFVKLYTLESMTVKQTLKEHRMLLRKGRVKYLMQFILFNGMLNGVLFIAYALVLSSIAFMIYLTRGQSLVLGTILTFIYSFYLVATTITSLILIPVNYALISLWYYQKRPKNWINTKFKRYQKRALTMVNRVNPKPIILTLFIFLIGLNVTNVVSLVRDPFTPVELLKRADVIAHRGASLSAPENTLAALDLAIEYGADGVEFDVQVSADGVPVLMHDVTLGRTTNDALNRRVDSLTLSQLRQLDAGSWFADEFEGEQIPTLEEALERIDGRAKAYIDLKARGSQFNHDVVSLIEAFQLESSSVVMSFDYQQLREIKELNSDVQTLLLISTFFGDIEALVQDDNIDYFAFRTFVIANNQNYIRQVQQAGKKVYVWTLETEQEHQQFIELDVDGLISKDPILARELVYTRNTPTLYREVLRQLFPR